MSVTAIVKSASKLEVTPNLLDYDASLAPGFWERAREELDGLPGDGGLNIAYEAVDRHAFGALADHLALRCLGRHGEVRDFTYAELGRETSRFANALRSLGVGKGDLVGVLAGRIPELYVSALGTLKNRSVVQPALLRLRSGADPDPSGDRQGARSW